MDTFHEYISKKIDQRYRITFASTWIIGLLCHAMMIFNKYCLHDDLTQTYKYGTSIASGRWGLELLGKLEALFYGGNGHFSLPVLNGTLSILFIAVSACLVVYLLGIESPAGCAFSGAFLVAFPSVTATFFFMFTAHYYFFAYLLTVIGVCLICKGQKIWMKVLAALIIAFAIGVYQAYIPSAITLMILYLFQMLHKDEKIKSIFKKSLCMLSCTVLFMAIYFAINKAFLYFTNTQLGTHKGVDTMETTSISGYLKRIPSAIRYFFVSADSGSSVVYPLHIQGMYYVLLICLEVGAIFYVVSFFKKKRIAYGILYVILCTAFPIGVTMIYVMTPEAPHQLMEYSQVFPFIALVMMIDQAAASPGITEGKRWKTAKNAAYVYLSLVLLMYAQFSNVNYLKAGFVQEQAKSYFTTLVTRIKSMEGYEDDMKVVFINLKDLDDDSMTSSLPWFEGYNMVGNYDLDKTVTGYSYRNFMERWCGFSSKMWVDQDKFLADAENALRVRNMKCYPDDGSMRIINNTVVVKFGPETETAN